VVHVLLGICILFPFQMSFVSLKNNSSGATSGVETVHSTRHLVSPVVLVRFVLLNLSFLWSVLLTNVCHFVHLHFAIVLSILRLTASDYPFGIYTIDITVYKW